MRPKHPVWIIEKRVYDSAINFGVVFCKLIGRFHQGNLMSSVLVCCVSQTICRKGSNCHQLKVSIWVVWHERPLVRLLHLNTRIPPKRIFQSCFPIFRNIVPGWTNMNILHPVLIFFCLTRLLRRPAPLQNSNVHKYPHYILFLPLLPLYAHIPRSINESEDGGWCRLDHKIMGSSW